jgi:predicted  nucleic acid-binding Zn-ribbon protein
LEALPERVKLRELDRRRTALEVELAEVRSQVDDLAGRQRQLEERIAAAAGRRHQIEQRMLTGDVTASRDLQAMDTEVHQLSSRQEHFEEEELALLEEEEPLDVLLAERQAALEALAAEGSSLEAAVAEAEEGIRASIVTEQRMREEAASGLPAELSERYEALRARMGGVGAARLVGDHCDGCHLTLPSGEVARIRSLPPSEFATCDQCGRILVH